MRMNYFVVGTNDMAAAIAFYDALFEGNGLQRVHPSDRMTYWLGADFAFAVSKPFDQRPATHGNGTMVGFQIGLKERVDELYHRALSLGGTDEGQPGQRGPRYSAYVRDRDGNKLCFSA